MELLHHVSIMLEIVVMVLGVLIATIKKRRYGWLIALSFGIYVFHDITQYLSLNIPKDMIYFVFFVATGSILIAVWRVYQRISG